MPNLRNIHRIFAQNPTLYKPCPLCMSSLSKLLSQQPLGYFPSPPHRPFSSQKGLSLILSVSYCPGKNSHHIKHPQSVSQAAKFSRSRQPPPPAQAAPPQGGPCWWLGVSRLLSLPSSLPCSPCFPPSSTRPSGRDCANRGEGRTNRLHRVQLRGQETSLRPCPS